MSLPPVLPLHGLGGARDLPIPAELAIAGGTAALLVSFSVLILAWRSPRFDAARQGRPLPAGLARVVDSAAVRWDLRVLGLVAGAVVALTLVAGVDDLTNPVFGIFYVVLWVGLVPLSLLCGPFWRLVSPVRTLSLLLARLTGGDPRRGIAAYPERLGYWPAAVGLFAFVWQELVNPDQVLLSSVRLWLAAYVGILLVGAAVYGERWLERADPFEVYSTLVGHLSPLGRRADGVLVLRNPLVGLDAVEIGPGLVAVVSVLFGSTAFDSWSEQPSWLAVVAGSPVSESWTGTAGLLLCCVVVGVSFTLATMAVGRDVAVPRRELPARLAPSVVPIVVGYMVAHYLSFLVEQSQVVVRQLSDPLSTGADYLGTAALSVNYWLSEHPTGLAVTKVLAIVTGHILGAVTAHDRALRLLPRRHQVTGQLGLLLVMVCYTATGLYLLFGA